MKAQEMIDKLKEIKQEHGNIELHTELVEKEVNKEDFRPPRRELPTKVLYFKQDAYTVELWEEEVDE